MRSFLKMMRLLKDGELTSAGSHGQMTDEQLARQLQEQLDMEDGAHSMPSVHHPPGPSIRDTHVPQGAQDQLQASLQNLFSYDNRADEDDGGGFGGRRGGRGGRRGRGRGRSRRS